MTKWILVLVLLAGCGQQEEQADDGAATNYGYGYNFDAITPSGLRLRYYTASTTMPFGDATYRATAMEQSFSQVKACTGLDGNPPLVIIVPAGTFDPSDEFTYFATNTILIEDGNHSWIYFEWLLQHGMVHALLASNGFHNDANAAHESPLFELCARMLGPPIPGGGN